MRIQMRTSQLNSESGFECTNGSEHVTRLLKMDIMFN